MVTLLSPLLATSTTAPATAATPITVAQALAAQNGSTATVRGYVVGQPTATNTVVTSNYPNDYALALADSATETSTSKMVYVQITSAFRAAYGLKTNPSLKGQQLDVTGSLSAYFSHPGLTSTTAFAKPAVRRPRQAAGRTTAPTTPNAIGKTGTGAASRAAHDHHEPDQADLRPGLERAQGHRPGPEQQRQRDPALLRPLAAARALNGGGVDDWNREHVWAKSHGDFGTATGPGTDLHHLRPEDVTVNCTRGNKDFDNGGTAVAEAPGSCADADSFEPRDAVKGDVARMILYMAVRYEGDDGFAEPRAQRRRSATAPRRYIGRLSRAASSGTRRTRRTPSRSAATSVIYDTWQHNRNPFIDHPEWANAIFN